jgi:hypothetical protein
MKTNIENLIEAVFYFGTAFALYIIETPLIQFSLAWLVFGLGAAELCRYVYKILKPKNNDNHL